MVLYTRLRLIIFSPFVDQLLICLSELQVGPFGEDPWPEANRTTGVGGPDTDPMQRMPRHVPIGGTKQIAKKQSRGGAAMQGGRGGAERQVAIRGARARDAGHAQLGS